MIAETSFLLLTQELIFICSKSYAAELGEDGAGVNLSLHGVAFVVKEVVAVHLFQSMRAPQPQELCVQPACQAPSSTLLHAVEPCLWGAAAAVWMH